MTGGHSQVYVAAAAGKPDPEVFDFDEASVASVGRTEVDQLQRLSHVLDNLPVRVQTSTWVEVDQRVDIALLAVVHEGPHAGDVPGWVKALGVGVQSPPDFSGQQRPQATQVDLPDPHHRQRGGAPAVELGFVAVADRHGDAAELVVLPLRRK